MNIPQLRFPEFVDGWNNDTLDNLTERIGDGLHGTPEYVNNSNIHFINGNNLIDGRIQINENTKKVSIQTFEQNSKNLSDKTLLISINGTIGSVAKYNNEKVMLGKSVGYFNFKENPDFFYYLLNTSNIQNYFISELTGSTIKNLSLKTLRETKVNYPNNIEQTKIANFLTAVDEKIQALKKKQILLEQYKKGVMQKLFSQELRFKDENGNDFPDWEVKKLGEVCEITIGEFVIKTKQNPNGKYPVFNGGVAPTGYYDEFNNEGNKIIISARGANAGFVNFQKEKYWAGNSCYSISVLNQNLYSIQYFFYYIKMFESNFTENQQAANIPSVSKTDVENFKIDLPTLLEQTKIANFLSAIDEKINHTKTQIEKMQEWKKGLLQRMFV